MYFPEFSVTTNILNFSGQIEAAKAVIEVIPVVSSWEKSLEREAALKTIYHLNHFDGVKLSQEEVKYFFEGKDVSTAKSVTHEIENTQEALDFVKARPDLNEETLKMLHSILVKGITHESKTGYYRKTPIQNYNSSFIQSAGPDEVVASLLSFFAWLETPDAKEIPAPVRSSIIYLEFIKVSPFDSHNKKIAALFALLNLYINDYDKYKAVTIDKSADENPTSFFQAIRSTQNPTGDITRWIEYYVSNLTQEFSGLKDKIVSLSKENKVRAVAGMAPLNERQERVVEYLHDYGSIQNKDFARLFYGISEDTILRDLKDLISKKIIQKVGSTKSSRYTIATTGTAVS